MSQKFSLGDLVWAKMEKYPYWPGKIMKPPKRELDALKNNPSLLCVYFFGTDNYGLVKDSCIKPYEKFKNKMRKSCKTKDFKKAIRDIENVLINSHNKDAVCKKQLVKKHRKEIYLQDLNSLNPNNKESSSSKSGEGTNSTKSIKKGGRPKGSIHRQPRLNLNIEIHDRSVPLETQNDNFSFTPKHFDHINKYYSPGPRPQIVIPDVPELHPFDATYVSDITKNKIINPSDRSFGFLWTGSIGASIIKNLVHTKHKVCIWNCSPDKSEPFKIIGVQIYQSPIDVVRASDIIFSCQSDKTTAKELVFGVISEMNPNKAYVEMSAIDSEASLDIAEEIACRGGKYLEVRYLGGQKEADDGRLVVFAAGDSRIYSDCESCFQAIGEDNRFLGSEVGQAVKVSSIMQLLAGVTFSGVAEALALADSAGIEKQLILNFVEKSKLSCPFILENGTEIKDKNVAINPDLDHLRQGVKLALNLGERFDQRLPVAATAHEMLVYAKQLR